MKILLLLSAVTAQLTMYQKGEINGGPEPYACSAVYVAPHTLITNAHCTKDITDGKIWVHNGKDKVLAKVVAIEELKDLALVHVDGAKHPYAVLGNKPEMGDEVQTYYFTFSKSGIYGRGMVESFFLDEDTECKTIMDDIPILPGASGSGLFDMDGKMIGVNHMKYDGNSYVIDTTPMKEFLKDNASKLN